MTTDASEECYWCGKTPCICLADDEEEARNSWLCQAGHFHEDGLHCSTTGEEPPWGCPCGFCQDGDGESEDDDMLGMPPYGDCSL